MSSIKKLVSRMAADQVPTAETGEVAEQTTKKKHILKEPKQQGKIQQAPRPKTARKQSQKGG